MRAPEPAVLDPAALDAALRRLAAAGRTASYLELVEALALAGPHRIHRLTLALEARVHADHAAGRPLLAALAVGRLGLPGRGFFQLLQSLGRYEGADAGAAAACHRRELAAALAFWGAAPPEQR